LAACSGNSCPESCQDSMTVVFLEYDQWQPGGYRLVIDDWGECSGEVGGADAAFMCTNERVSFESGVLTISAKVDSMRMETYRDGNRTGVGIVNPDYDRPEPECHPECRQAYEEIPA